MSEFRRALLEKQEMAKRSAPEGMELVGWKVHGEDRISQVVLVDPLARPLYAFT